MSALREKVEYKTIDGVVIRGLFYAVGGGPAPAIIMTHGFNCVKDMLLPELAEWFQSLGFNTLIYDPRSIGDSDGLPRNHISPLQQAEDLSDIVTHVASLPSVDARRIVLWGMSFGATVSACAAAVDRRVKALVMVCPIFSFIQPEKREKAFAQLIRDRQSQLRGNEPFSLPPVNSRDRITLQTYHKLALFRPKELLDLVRTLVQMIVPELDDISPAKEQEEALGRFEGPKEIHIADGKGHLTVLSGSGSKEIWQAMVNFIRHALD
ncbi:hypothetical protein GQ607_016395 [Colletotrichum asianum]|uniref:AB hydrolase-1 domain-containing protein n=1 Tax=Colletotrichum asianum TaxID=702518 RepID=A0A8H3ZLU3_9PEZI|nr:hypothetical protein GQ607_016395 [Colletotrichum asianum]